MKKLSIFIFCGLLYAATMSAQQTWNCGAQGDNVKATLYGDGTFVISGTGEMKDFGWEAPWDDVKSSITKVIIEDGVTSISKCAFYECKNIASATISDDVLIIGEVAFYGCSSLKTIAIPNGVSALSAWTFGNCTGLTSVTIGNNVIEMFGAFLGCTALVSIEIAAGNTNFSSVDGVVFNYDKTTLVMYPNGKQGAYTIPGGVTEIGYAAFVYCEGLTTVNIHANVTEIGFGAFAYCAGLTAIEVAAGNNDYCSVAGVLFNKDKTVLIQYPAGKQGAYTIPSGVTAIGDLAFTFSFGLTSITIPVGVTKIGIEAFSHCTSLITVTIPEGVTTIGNVAFVGCSALTTVILPASITYIDDDAFNRCDNLTSVTCLALTPPTLGSDVFSGISPNCTLYVPAGAKAAYMAINQWKRFNIVELGSETIVGTWNCGAQGDNVKATLYSNGTLIISGTGEMANYDRQNPSPWSDNIKNIKTVIIEEGVTSVGASAFTFFSFLSSVTISESVTKIGYTAFMSTALTSVNIHAGVTDIGLGAFVICQFLQSINVEEGNRYFSSIDGILFNKEETELIQYPGSRQGVYSISDDVVSIGYGAFGYCMELTSLTIPARVLSIGEYAFAGCTGLTSITVHWDEPLDISGKDVFDDVETDKIRLIVPAGTKSKYSTAPVWKDFKIEENSEATIVNTWNCGAQGDNVKATLYSNGTLIISGTGEMADYGSIYVPWLDVRNYIKTAIIEDGVTSIGEWAFDYCTALSSVTISGSVKSIGFWSFARTGLMFVNIPYGVTFIDAYAFYECKELLEVRIPESVNSISEFAFGRCFKLAFVLFSDGITTIERYAFERCTALTSVIIPGSVTEIGEGAFERCTELTSATIPESVTEIGYGVFGGCANLASITVQWEEEPLDISNKDLFWGVHINNVRLIVPAGTKAKYLAAPVWKNFLIEESGGENNHFSGGDGSEADPYVITTPAQLAKLAELVNDGETDYNAAYYQLGNDIDLSGYQSGTGWTPIGISSINSFKGNFDGNNQKITGLYIKPTGGTTGLFRYIIGAEIKNLGVENVDINHNGWSNVGGIAGYVEKSSIADCYVTGTISTIGIVGGIAGQLNKNSSISNCYFIGTANGSTTYGSAGGIAGDISESSIINCFADGVIIGHTNVGGIVGVVFKNSNVTNCYSMGTVNGSNNSTGGIAGYVDTGCSVTNCAALNPSVKCNYDVGRVVGYNSGTLSGNIAFSGMTTDGGAAFSGKYTHDGRDGADITIEAIHADGTLGGRFTAANGWTTQNGKLPGLFGKTVEMPVHLGGNAPTTYPVIVNNGTGGGDFAAGATVTIMAGTPPAGQQFKNWTSVPAVTFVDGTSATSSTAKFTMPANAVTVTANFEAIPAAALTGTPTISNTAPRIGDALTGSLAGGNNTGTLTYVWKSAGVQVGTGAIYTVALADLAKTITLDISSSVETGTLTSAPTATVLKKAAPAAPVAPTLAAKTHNTVTLTANALYEFSMNAATWQQSAVFSGLTANTAYSFYQRIAETNDTEASAASAKLDVTTDGITGTETRHATSLQAWMRNGLLHVTGLTVGETLSIYSASGALVYQNVVASNDADIPLTAQGVYIVKSEDKTVKVIIQ